MGLRESNVPAVVLDALIAAKGVGFGKGTGSAAAGNIGNRLIVTETRESAV